MKELRAKSLLLTAYLEGVIQRKYGRGGKVMNGGEDWKHVHVDIALGPRTKGGTNLHVILCPHPACI